MQKVCVIFTVLFLSCFPVFSEESKPIITVLDMKTEDVSKSEMNIIINRLSSALFQTDKYTVIDVSQREQILKELEFSLSGCSDDSCMLEVGKMLSAESIVVGSLGRIGSRIAVSIKMLETETGRTLSTADDIYNDINELVDGVPELAAKLAGLKENNFASGSKPPEKKAPDIKSIAAWSTAGAGAVSAGIGAYLIAVSVPYITDYTNAYDAYEAATAGADFDSLRTLRDDAYQAAVDAKAEEKLTAGIILGGAGLAFGISSALLFLLPENSADVKVALLPLPGGTALSFSLSY